MKRWDITITGAAGTISEAVVMESPDGRWVEHDEAAKAVDQGYTERNRLVAFLARIFPSGTRRTAIPGWDPEWHGCVFVDTPEGQMSWHYHDRDAHLFAELPPYDKPWDGHATPEKYERLMRLNGQAALLRRHIEDPMLVHDLALRRTLAQLMGWTIAEARYLYVQSTYQ